MLKKSQNELISHVGDTSHINEKIAKLKKQIGGLHEVFSAFSKTTNSKVNDFEEELSTFRNDSRFDEMLTEMAVRVDKFQTVFEADGPKRDQEIKSINEKIVEIEQYSKEQADEKGGHIKGLENSIDELHTFASSLQTEIPIDLSLLTRPILSNEKLQCLNPATMHSRIEKMTETLTF